MELFEQACRLYARDAPSPLTAFAPVMAKNKVHEIADAHFHLGDQYLYFTVLSLFRQSKLLWSPSKKELTIEPVAPDDPTFMFTNNIERLPPRTR